MLTLTEKTQTRHTSYLIRNPLQTLTTGLVLQSTLIKAFDSPLSLENLNGTNGFVLNGVKGVNTYDQSGCSVSTAGDVNGDGITDIIIGAPSIDPRARGIGTGAIYVVFGHHGSWTSTMSLGSLNGTNGFIMVSGGAFYSGRSVSTAGDVNSDGITDLIVTSGANACVIFGHNGSWASTISLGSLNGANGFILTGVAAGDYSGASVGTAGDVDGDGLADLFIGAYGANNNEYFVVAIEPMAGLEVVIGSMIIF